MDKTIKILLLIATICGIATLNSCTHKVNNYEYVDLGLPSGNLWATCNVGAKEPTDIGSYFAWGETKPKSTYTWDNYKYSLGDSVMTKYNLNRRQKYADGLFLLQPSDDAATVNMGGPWCTPTMGDYYELVEMCKKAHVTNYENTGVDGVLYTSKTNGKKLFIPKSYIYDNNKLEKDTVLHFAIWTSELNYDFEYCDDDNNIAMLKTNYNSACEECCDLCRYYGMPVRAIVKGDKHDTTNDLKIKSLYYLHYDKIEDTPKYKAIINKVESEVDDSLTKACLKTGPYQFYIYLDAKKKILKKHGIDWKTPEEMNPELFEYLQKQEEGVLED